MSLTALVTNVLTNDTTFNKTLDSASYHLVFRIFGGVTILTTISTFLLDIFLLLYFLQCRRTTSTKIYSILLIADFCISLSGVFISYDLFTYQTTEAVQINNSTTVHYFEDKFAMKEFMLARLSNSLIFGLGSRFSAMLNCVLSVNRAIAIALPFYEINYLRILTILACYLLIWAAAYTLLFTNTDYVVCKDLHFVCEPRIYNASILLSMVLFVVIPFALPCAPVLLASLVIIVIRLKTGSGTNLSRSTRTVLLLSVTFLVCNGSFVLCSTFIEPPRKDNLADRGKFIVQFYILKTLSVFVNAFLNAIILVIRSSGVRGFVFRLREGQLTIETFTHPERARRSTAATTPSMRKPINAMIALHTFHRSVKAKIKSNGDADEVHGQSTLENAPVPDAIVVREGSLPNTVISLAVRNTTSIPPSITTNKAVDSNAV